MIFLAVGYDRYSLPLSPEYALIVMKNLFLLSLVAAAALVAASAMYGQSSTPPTPTGFKVVVHPSNPFGSLSRSQISNFLLKKKSRWKNGWQVDPVDLDSRSSVRAEMSQFIHERSVASIKNYWQRQIFSGHNTPPPELDTDQAVVDFVKSNRGGIGYVSVDFATSGVKVITISD